MQMLITRISAVLIIAALPSLVSPRMAIAQESDPAVIHFASVGGIRDWRVADDGDALLIEGRNGLWYRATFFNYCPEIRFQEALAFVTDATGDLTKFSSVIADGTQCYFKSFERTSDPDERPDRIDG